MTIKKLLLLACMGLAAVSLAAPGIASAEWTVGGNKFDGNTKFIAHGPAKFATFLGGVECENTTATIILVGTSTTGYIQDFIATEESNCHGSGNLANCTVNETELTGEEEDRVLHAEGGDIVVTGIQLRGTYVNTPGAEENCAVEETELDFLGEDYITVELDPNAEKVETLTLSAPSEQGGVLTAFGLEVPGVEVSGSLTITPHGSGPLSVDFS